MPATTHLFPDFAPEVFPDDELPQGTVDQRRHPRFSVQGDAEIVVKNGASLFRGRILNISESGCYIQTLAYVRLAPGTPVRVLFTVKGRIVSVVAEARLSTPRVGIGFRFINIDRQNDQVIRNLLKALSMEQGVPPLVPSEAQ